jgi:hypothetical protein
MRICYVALGRNTATERCNGRQWQTTFHLRFSVWGSASIVAHRQLLVGTLAVVTHGDGSPWNVRALHMRQGDLPVEHLAEGRLRGCAGKQVHRAEIGSTISASPCIVARQGGRPTTTASPHISPVPGTRLVARPGKLAWPCSFCSSTGSRRTRVSPSRPQISRPTNATGPSIAGNVWVGLVPRTSCRSASPLRDTSSHRPVRDKATVRGSPDSGSLARLVPVSRLSACTTSVVGAGAQSSSAGCLAPLYGSQPARPPAARRFDGSTSISRKTVRTDESTKNFETLAPGP